ncbi:hypothetical protein VNI00_003027 [Paramarasmius palmivorus]|uniref:F-box domain-containing protein n=1 Tax=Paramarasmius palmivorus TaxID=297713 RepID=A0AAW0DYL3_9AGAR
METPIQSPSPALEGLLQTNEMPSQTVRLACRGELSIINHRLAAIAHEVSEIEQRAATLREEESRLRAYIPTYQRILNPVRGLPADILSEIFMLASYEVKNTASYFMSPSSDALFYDKSLDTTRPPWTFGQVCRSWRRVATTTPLLWRTIRIEIPAPSSSAQRKRAMAHRLTIALSRSRDLPLHIELKSFYPIAPDDLLLFTLCSHSSRWEQLRFSFRFVDSLEDVVHAVSSLVKSNVHLLRSVYLDFQGYLPEGCVLDAFEDAPKLQCVIIRALTPDIRAGLRIPWRQITHFYRLQSRNGCSYVPSTSAEHLIEMPNVVKYADADFYCPPGAQIHLPHLQTLAITFPAGNGQSPVALDRLQIGAQLRDFRFDINGRRRRGEELDIQTFISFIRTRGGTLQSLSMYHWSHIESDCVEMLSGLQELRSLSMFCDGQEARDELLRALLESPGHFLPQMQHLLLFGRYYGNGNPISREALFPMLQARLQGSVPLQTIGFPTQQRQLSLGEADRLRARGLSIRTTSIAQWVEGFMS